MIHIKATVALIAILLSLSSCSHPNEKDALFLRADALMEEHPDSALSLLQLPSQDINELSEKECSRYALLLARATDKNKMSLLPCDSLLNVAIDYYDDDEKEKALALLYKGRLAVEMEQIEEATSYLQEALSIIQNFPKELKTKNLILSSLGNIYFGAKYFEEAIVMYQDLYKCSITDLDKSIALNNISTYYCIIGEKDSTLTTQRKALNYAIASKDSLQIAISSNCLSLEFKDFGELDSALFYAQNALNKLPPNENHGNYYANLGELLLKKGESKDLAHYYLNKSLEDIPLEGKVGCLESLYELEKDNGNYIAANLYLEAYTDIIDSLYYMEQSLKTHQLIYEYNTKMRVKEEQIRGNRIVHLTIAGFILICFLIIIIYQNQINRKKRLQLQYRQSLEQTQNKLITLQATIENNQLIINALQKEQSNFEQKQRNNEKQIEVREQIIAELNEEKLRLTKWLFAQSNIYKKVVALSNQMTSNKKEIKILTASEQKQLKDTVFELFQDSISSFKKAHPKLSEDDLLYLCLEKISFEPKTIAICFGYSDLHTLNQKKYRIRKRMMEEQIKV